MLRHLSSSRTRNNIYRFGSKAPHGVKVRVEADRLTYILFTQVPDQGTVPSRLWGEEQSEVLGRHQTSVLRVGLVL